MKVPGGKSSTLACPPFGGRDRDRRGRYSRLAGKPGCEQTASPCTRRWERYRLSKPRERELPGAILAEYGEPTGREPQGRELVSRITSRIEKLGGESAIRPQKVASRSPAVASENSERARETELE